MREVTLKRENGDVVCDRCVVAASPFSRMKGLLGRSELRPGEGLLLRPASAIHTFFMRFPLDVAFLSREGLALGVAEGVRPWRFARAPRDTKFVLELAAGQAAAHGVVDGVQLEFDGGWETLSRRRRL